MLLLLWNLLRVVLILCLLAVSFMHVFGTVPSIKRFKLIQKIPGPKGLFYFGNILEFMAIPPHDILNFLKNQFVQYNRFMRVWLLGYSTVYLKDPLDVQSLCCSIEHINKGLEYFILHPWLNEGLLTSTGEKWHVRRKLLTPAFHFKILEESMTVMAKKSKLLTDKLVSCVGTDLILEDFIGMCTLDVIITATMGINIEEYGGGGEKYVASIKKLSHLMTYRMMRPHLFNEVVFRISPSGRSFYNAVKNLHEFSNKVIREKKIKFTTQSDKRTSNPIYQYGKVHNSFLDLMLEYESNNPGTFSDNDIREEVDTFMFEGHDTTSTALVYIFYNLAKYPEIQEKVYQEIHGIFRDSDREPTFNDLQNMVYTEKVIKESLRLYPSVPAISRLLDKDLVLSDGVVLPPMANVVVLTYVLHRNEQHWPEPEKFDPERFSDEQTLARHPYAYVPFSAGPRNCIGQKFAMMELKTVMSTVLRRLKVEPVTENIDPHLFISLVLRSSKPVKCKFSLR